MSPSNPRPTYSVNQRRSQRILLTVPVLVAGERMSGTSFSEVAVTSVINAQGAMILLKEYLILGQMLTLSNLSTDEKIKCKVVDIVPGTAGKREVGVEFMDLSPHFWRVTFPPPDWSARSWDAKKFAKSDTSTAVPESGRADGSLRPVKK